MLLGACQRQPEGTSGTPEVGTTATYDLRGVRVEQVTPTGTECE